MAASKVFISYSWDDESHKKWVKTLAAQLRKDGIDVIIDQWHVQPGDQLPSFMEAQIKIATFVLIVCTPSYKRKSDNRSGGVGYEGDVIQGEVFVQSNHRKFIPILRTGVWTESAPHALLGKAYIDLREGSTYTENYSALLSTLHRVPVQIPEIGERPEFIQLGESPHSVLTICDESMRSGIKYLDMTHDGRHAAILDPWQKLSVWDLRKPRRLQTVDVPKIDNQTSSYGVKINHDGTQVLSLTQAGLSLLDVISGKMTQLDFDDIPAYWRGLNADPMWSHAILFSSHSIQIREIANNNVLRILSMPEEGFWRSRFNPHFMMCLAVDRSGERMVTGTSQGQIKIWDLHSTQAVSTLYAHSNAVTNIAIQPDGKSAVSCSGDTPLRIWNLENGRELRNLSGHTQMISDIKISANGEFVVAGSTDGNVRIWNFLTGRLFGVLPHGKAIESVAVSSDGRYVLSSASDKFMKLWELNL